jgi:hypothetical protein
VSASKSRKAGAPAFPKNGPRLRLVKNTDKRPRPELKTIIEDVNRRHRERAERAPGGKDAA